MSKTTNKRITGIGSALVDVLINETDQFLQDLGKVKGGMTLVEDHDIEQILSKTTQTPMIVPGGAACNTIVTAVVHGNPPTACGLTTTIVSA